MQGFLDLMRQVYGREAVDAMASRFGLGASGLEQAISALAPVYAEGFRRTLASPSGFRQLFEMLAAHPGTAIVDQMAQAVPPEASAKGREIMAAVLGSPRVQEALAAHAATQAGVQQAVMAEMMPLVGNAILQSVVDAQNENPFFAAWKGLFAPDPPAAPPPPPPEPDAVESMMAMWRGALGMSTPEPEAAPAPPPEPEPTLAEQSLRDFFAFGRQWQDAQHKAVSDILDAADRDSSPKAGA